MSEGIRAVTMPKWGLAMTEGLVNAWHVEVGETIERGQDVVDVETEKITNVFESPVGGVVRRRLVEAGEVAPVGALLAVVTDSEVGDADIEAFVAEFQARFEQSRAAAAAGEDDAPRPCTAEAGGLTLRYLAMGEGEAAPLVLLHGFGGDLNNWLFNQPALAEALPVVAVDLPGHGGSTKRLEETGLPAIAGAVRALLDTLDIPRAHFAGHSLGGAVALQIASDDPARLRSLTLLASVGLGEDIDTEYIRGFIEAGRRKALKPVVERLFADPGLVSREMLDDLLKFKRIDGVPEVLARIAEAVFAGGRQSVAFRPVLNALQVPAQVIWGAEDRIVPAAHAAGLDSRIGAHVLDGAGHMVHMERSAEVNALIEGLVG